jgi:hypothetical protein
VGAGLMSCGTVLAPVHRRLSLPHSLAQALSRFIVAAAAAEALEREGLAAHAHPQLAPSVETALPASAAAAGSAAADAGAAPEPDAGGTGARPSAASSERGALAAGEAAGGSSGTAAADPEAGPGPGPERAGAAAEAGLPALAQRVLFAQLKRTLAASSLAVRQVRGCTLCAFAQASASLQEQQGRRVCAWPEQQAAPAMPDDLVAACDIAAPGAQAAAGDPALPGCATMERLLS